MSEAEELDDSYAELAELRARVKQLEEALGEVERWRSEADPMFIASLSEEARMAFDAARAALAQTEDSDG